MIIKKSNTLCDRPFIHLHARGDGEVRPCCIAAPFSEPLSMADASVEDVWNSGQMKRLRLDMLAGVRNPACNECYTREDRGETSPRLLPVDEEHSGKAGDIIKRAEYDFARPQPDGAMPLEIQFLDIRFSNLCNQKCRMCDHSYSSQWYDDSHKMAGRDDSHKKGPRVIRISDNTVERLLPFLGHLKTVYFAGGEPLLMLEHFQLLTWLRHNARDHYDEVLQRPQKDVDIFYNTNLTVLSYKNMQFADLWKHFRSVKLSLSCDGFGHVGEYQRTGFKHDKFFANLDALREFAGPMRYSVDASENRHKPCHTRIIYDFQFTTTVYNVFHIFEFLDFLIARGYIPDTNTVNLYYAWSPAEVALNNARDKGRIVEFLEKGKSGLSAQKTITEIDNLISFTKSDNNISYDELVSWNNRLDAIRGTDGYFNQLLK